MNFDWVFVAWGLTVGVIGMAWMLGLAVRDRRNGPRRGAVSRMIDPAVPKPSGRPGGAEKLHREIAA